MLTDTTALPSGVTVYVNYKYRHPKLCGIEVSREPLSLSVVDPDPRVLERFFDFVVRAAWYIVPILFVVVAVLFILRCLCWFIPRCFHVRIEADDD